MQKPEPAAGRETVADDAIAAGPWRGWWALPVLSFVGFVASFGAHVVAVNLPVYAEQVGVGVVVIGLLIAVYDLAEIGAKPVFGLVADRAGMRGTLRLGLALFALSSLVYLVVDPRLLLGVRFLQGLGAAAFSVVSLALVATYFPQARGRAYGVYNALKGAGYVVSPALGGAVVAGSSFAAVFVLAAGVGLVAFLGAFTLPAVPGEDRVDLDDDDDDLSPRAMLAALADRPLLPWYAVIVANMFLVGVLFGFLPVYAHGLGYDPLRAGLLVSVCTACYVLVQPVAGWLADRTSPARTVVVGLLVAAAATVVVPFTAGIPLVAAVALGGLGVGTVWTNSDAAVAALARAGRLGAAVGAAGSFKELGDMLGPLTIGVLAQAAGLPTAFVLCGLLGALGTALLARVTAPGRA